ncbi:hypothetical protein [Desulfonatronovibrio hydrogenovorans]|uniref:hypothetical protein n=1 Tax=Desulfonatronovibrio hydrogenovorans TaxID=53245 RepID=UPI00048DD84D|nr:hypothetical protein [Desulfonatronovibrio hydrogenovorans]
MKKTGMVMIMMVMSAVLCQNSFAGEYLGLKIGKDSREEVMAMFDKRGGAYGDNWGYRGYTELSMLKINRYENMDRLGKVNQAWLYFTPEDVLYRIAVEYADPGQTFKVVKDALDGNYGRPGQSGFGFTEEYLYRHGRVRIDLVRNSFGFGDMQTTTLSYTYEPALAEVEKMKEIIEEDIRRINAEKVGGDL